MSTDTTISASSHLSDALNFLSKIPVRENERISWESHKLDEGTFQLLYSLKFSPSIDDHIKDAGIWSTLTECARANDFSSKFFLKGLRAYLKTYHSKKVRKYSASTQLNLLSYATPPEKLKSILSPACFRKDLSKGDQKIVDGLKHYERSLLDINSDFMFMSCAVSAIDDRSALNLAYKNIKFCLGVLNILTGGYGVSKRFGFPNAPIGKLLLAAPIVLFDRKHRKLGDFISESHFPSNFKTNFSVSGIEAPRIKKFFPYYLSDLKRVDFSEKLTQAVILFQEGLETSHIDIALLKFWTGIELLCSKETKEVTEKVIERASSIFVEPKIAAMRLNFIQEFRNRIVHRGEASDHALLNAQWASNYLAGIIDFCLFNKYRLREHSEILDYLSIPLDSAKIQRTLRLNKRRLSSIGSKTLG